MRLARLYRAVVYPLVQLVVWSAASLAVVAAATLVLAVVFNRQVAGGLTLVEFVVRTLPQVAIDGLTIGFLYAMIALGYTMVYGVLQLINFAHSEIFMVGAFVGVEIMLLLNLPPDHPTQGLLLIILLTTLAAAAASGLLAVGIERVAYRPLRTAPRLVPLISAIGVSFFLQDTVRAIEGLVNNAFFRNYPSFPALNEPFTLASVILFGELITVQMQPKIVLIIVVSLAMLTGLNYLVNATRLGRAIRAVAQDQPTAALMGVNVDRIIMLTFLIGGALGGATGVLFGIRVGRIDPYVGFIPGIKAFTAAVLGGIGNITGAMLGGLVLGILEAFAGAYLSQFTGGAFGSEYKDIFAFAILIVILIFRPTGLLGEIVAQRA
ncbi:MAG: branched-chain amino acid ABC transporter permease [Chloroflexota bacterium]